VGSILWGTLADRFTIAGTIDFSRIFTVAGWLGVAATLLLLIAFHPKTQLEPSSTQP